MINPVAKAALEYIGRPLTPGNADGTGNFQQPSLPETIKYATNTDPRRPTSTDRQRVYGRFSWYDRNSNYNNYFNNLATGEWFQFISRQAAFDHVWVMNSPTVHEPALRLQPVRARHRHQSREPRLRSDVAGLPGHRTTRAISEDLRRFPRFDIAGYQGTGFGGEFRPNETHSFVGTVNKSLGAHSIRTGFEFRRYAETSEFFANDQTGQFNFDSDLDPRSARQLDRPPSSLGQSFAAFLLGLPTSGSVAVPASYDEASSTYGLLSCRTTGASDRG